MEIKTGDPVILKDSTGLKEFGLFDGQKGWANAVTTIAGEGTYIFFMPLDDKHMHVVGADRLELDEEAKAAGLKLDENTIYKE